MWRSAPSWRSRPSHPVLPHGHPRRRASVRALDKPTFQSACAPARSACDRGSSASAPFRPSELLQSDGYSVDLMPGVIHVHHIPDLHAGGLRRVRVWTPSGYDSDRDTEFCSVYLQDGQNVFDAVGSFAGAGWQTHVVARKLLAEERIPPLILVAIDNSGERRANDYTPVAWRGDGGHAKAYTDLLIQQVQSFVDRSYRTRTTAAARAVVGSSLGGLFALHAGLQQPGVFANVVAMSPSLFWGDNYMMTAIPARPPHRPRIWLDVGELESRQLRSGARRMAGLLVQQGWRRHRSASRATFRYSVAARGNHDEGSWGRRFGPALQFAFPHRDRVPSE